MKVLIKVSGLFLIGFVGIIPTHGQDISLHPTFFCDESHSISIPANWPWTNTGIFVNSSQNIIILVKGMIFYGSDNWQFFSTAEGKNEIATSDFVVPGLKEICVIGKIGQSGTPFPVGEEIAFIANIPGELYLGINDNYFWDNSGNFMAYIITDLTTLCNQIKYPGFDINCYPNPFSYGLDIELNLTKSGFIHISVFNSNGIQIKDLFSGKLEKGKVVFTWNGQDENGNEMTRGTYIINLEDSEEQVFKKVIKL